MNPKKILISGGTGLIGSMLSNQLVQQGYIVHVLSRKKRQNKNGIFYFQWNIKEQTADLDAFKEVYSFIHLAGDSIAEGRWNKKKKTRIIDSRVQTAALAFECFKSINHFPEKVVSASGVGYYGTTRSETVFTETNPPNLQNFTSKVCQLWESAISPFQTKSQTSIFRIGVVLSNKGGALPIMTKPVKYFLGAPLGTGKQYIPWIHIKDLCRLFQFALENPLEGVFNAVATEHINNKEFTRKIAQQINRPLWPICIPSIVLKILLGEQSSIVLEGTRTSNEYIRYKGFSFRFNTVEKALKDLLH